MPSPIKMNIRVIVRVRPFTTREKAASQGLSVLTTPRQVSLYSNTNSLPLNYTVDTAIWSNGTEEDLGLEHVDNKGVYERVGREVVGKALEGKDCCVISFGGNATGKSYTFFGNHEETGLIQLSAMALMTTVSQLQMSMLECRGNGLKDLFTGQNCPFQATPQYRPIATPADLEVAISLGRRTWAGYNIGRMNLLSKPTHVLVKFQAVLSDGRQVNLLFADLAGEERTSRCCIPSKDSIAVNQSIHVFKETIKGLVARPGSLIPFRESVLTRVLRKPLEGSVFLLAMIAPGVESLRENEATLELCEFLRRKSDLSR